MAHAYLRTSETPEPVGPGCGKIPYATPEQAKDAMNIKRMRKKLKKPKGDKRRCMNLSIRPLQVYLCPLCPNPVYHIGHPESKLAPPEGFGSVN